MPIDLEQVRKIAQLAKLEFSASELEEFTRHFQEILDYFTQLESVSTETVEPTYHALEEERLQTPMREDRVGESLAVEEALGNAPDAREGQFRVPRVIEEPPVNP